MAGKFVHVALAAALLAHLAVPDRAGALPAKFSIVRVVEGLAGPTAFAFTPDGRMLVAERSGRVRVVRGSQVVSQPALQLSVATEGERGLLGLAIDPAFASNGWFYLYYTTAETPRRNRLSRFTLAGDTANAASETVLTDEIASDNGIHNGGWIDFGPDGKLYVSTGDGGLNRFNSAQLDNLNGKILRLESSGAAASGNPFAGQGGARPEIFAYGLRNPFRAAFHPDGRLFIGDVGQDAFEEIDVASATGGQNFGWPTSEGDTAQAGITPPVYAYAHERTAAVTLGAFSGTGVYPAEYQRVLFFADFMRDTLHVLRESSPGGAVTVEPFDSGRDSVTSMRLGPDGFIYYSSLFGGAIFRIEYEQPATSPTLTMAAAPAVVEAGEPILVTASVVPGTFPASTGVAVTVDLSAVGGSATQTVYDDGTEGDVMAGDGVWSYRAIVGGVPVGTAALSGHVVDAQGRAGDATVPVTIRAVVDMDADGLADRCEVAFGLNASSASAFDGAAGDRDADGTSNLLECAAGSHPRGYFTWHFAEGATGPFFGARLSLTNPRADFDASCPTCAAPAHVLLTFLRDDGTVVREAVTVANGTHESIDLERVPGLREAAFSIVVEADVDLIVERTMTWDDRRYGATSERGIAAPGLVWFLAEGATHSGFELFYLLSNTSDQTAAVTITYLLPDGAPPITRTYVVEPRRRHTVWVDLEAAQLAAADVSARITSTAPIIVERAMYLDTSEGTWGAGHAAAAVAATSPTWFFAEGATGPFFDTFLLLANPSPNQAVVDVSYLLPGGEPPIVKTYTLAADERRTIAVDVEDAALSDTAVSIAVVARGGTGIVAERSMWWPGPTPATWLEAHVSTGATQGGAGWSVGGGEAGGSQSAETFILIANTSTQPGTARVRVFDDDGEAATIDLDLPPSSRTNVPAGARFPGVVGGHFGATVQATGTAPVDLVVERSSYWTPSAAAWGAGTNAPGALARAADLTVRVTAAGLDDASITVARGQRIRFVNEDTLPHFIVSGGCGALEPLGVIGPGESAVTAVFVGAQTCAIQDLLQPGVAAFTGVVSVP